MNDADTNLIILVEAHEGAVQCLYRALNISLDNDVQILQLAFLNLVEEIIQGNLLGMDHLVALLLHTLLSNGTGLLLLQGCQLITGCWNIAETQNLYWYRRTSLLYIFATVIQHGTNLAEGSTGNNGITNTQGTGLYQYGSNRATALVQLCLNDNATGLTLRVGLQLLHLSYQ